MTISLLNLNRSQESVTGGGDVSAGTLKEKIAGLMYKQGIWRGVVLGLGAMMFIDGLGYTIWGKLLAPGPSFYVINQLPLGGTRLVGGIQLLLGILLVFARERNMQAKALLFVTFIFGIVIQCFTVAGWVAAHSVGVGAFSKWFLLCWLSLWLACTTLGRQTAGVRNDEGFSRSQ